MGRQGWANPGRARRARTARTRQRRRPHALRLHAAARDRRGPGPRRPRRSRDGHRLGGGDLRRAGDGRASRAVAHFSADRRNAECRRSGRGARRDRRRGRSRSAARRLQPAAEGLPRSARRMEAADRRPAGRERTRRGPRRRAATGRGPLADETACRRAHPYRLGRRRLRVRFACAPAGGDPRQHGNVALGAARHGRATDRGQRSGLLARAYGGRYGRPRGARHRRQSGDADADLLQRRCAMC